MNKKLSNNNKRSKIKKAVNIFGNAGKMDVASAIGAASSGIASIIDAAKSNAEINTTGADNIIESIESYKPATGSLDALADSYNNLNLNTIPNIPTIDSGKMLLNDAKAALSGASSGASMGGAWGALAGAGIGLIGSNIGTVRGIIKREEEESRINTTYNSAVKDARNKALASRDNILKDSTDKLMSELLAYGGPLFAYGGQTHGSDFTNGLMFINNGGTHESNPYEGVPISMDHEGTPNLVEEGEIIWNDYVFSNRLKVPKSIKKKYKLGNREMTFANAVDKLSKESEERPNDPISMRGLEKALLNMALEQENIRSKKEVNSKNNNKFVTGGPAGMYNDDYYIVPTGDKTAGIQPEVREGYVATSPVSPPEPEDTDSSKNLSTLLRYAPVIGSAINVATAFSQKPDYTNADAIINAAKNAATPIKFKPIGDYITYNPFDTEYHANQLRAISNATKKQIINNSKGIGAAAISGILASDNNTMNQLGNLYRKAAEYNLEQRQKVADFNRATNMFNTEGLFKVGAQNQHARLSGLEGITRGHLLREQIDNNLGATRSAALTGLFNNLGNIGKERVALSWLENNPGLSYMLSLNGNGVTFKNPNE